MLGTLIFLAAPLHNPKLGPSTGSGTVLASALGLHKDSTSSVTALLSLNRKIIRALPS